MNIGNGSNIIKMKSFSWPWAENYSNLVVIFNPSLLDVCPRALRLSSRPLSLAIPFIFVFFCFFLEIDKRDKGPGAAVPSISFQSCYTIGWRRSEYCFVFVFCYFLCCHCLWMWWSWFNRSIQRNNNNSRKPIVHWKASGSRHSLHTKYRFLCYTQTFFFFLSFFLSLSLLQLIERRKQQKKNKHFETRWDVGEFQHFSRVIL